MTTRLSWYSFELWLYSSPGSRHTCMCSLIFAYILYYLRIALVVVVCDGIKIVATDFTHCLVSKILITSETDFRLVITRFLSNIKRMCEISSLAALLWRTSYWGNSVICYGYVQASLILAAVAWETSQLHGDPLHSSQTDIHWLTS